jgi:hypothetical protein
MRGAINCSLVFPTSTCKERATKDDSDEDPRWQSLRDESDQIVRCRCCSRAPGAIMSRPNPAAAPQSAEAESPLGSSVSYPSNAAKKEKTAAIHPSPPPRRPHAGRCSLSASTINGLKGTPSEISALKHFLAECGVSLRGRLERKATRRKSPLDIRLRAREEISVGLEQWASKGVGEKITQLSPNTTVDLLE